MSRPYDKRSRYWGRSAPRKVRMVLENPSSRYDDEEQGAGIVYYTEWPRTVVDSASAVYPQLPPAVGFTGDAADSGFYYPATNGQGTYGTVSTAPGAHIDWDMADETKYGLIDRGGLLFRDSGIHVGMGGTFQFAFAFNSTILPASFYEQSTFYGSFRLTGIRVDITPRHHGRGGGTSSMLPNTLGDTAVPTGRFPGSVQLVDNTFYADAYIPQLDTLSSLSNMTAWYGFPTAAWNAVHPIREAAGLWNILGASDVERSASLRSVAQAQGAKSFNPYRPFSFYRKAYVLEDADIGIAQLPATSGVPTITTLQRVGVRDFPWVPIPMGGFRQLGVASSSGHQMEPFYMNIGYVVFDTNKWPVPYLQRPVASVQDFTMAAQIAAADAADSAPVLLNPPFAWDVTYTVYAEFRGRPVTAPAGLSKL